MWFNWMCLYDNLLRRVTCFQCLKIMHHAYKTWSKLFIGPIIRFWSFRLKPGIHASRKTGWLEHLQKNGGINWSFRTLEIAKTNYLWFWYSWWNLCCPNFAKSYPNAQCSKAIIYKSRYCALPWLGWSTNTNLSRLSLSSFCDCLGLNNLTWCFLKLKGCNGRSLRAYVRAWWILYLWWSDNRLLLFFVRELTFHYC